MTGPIKTVIFAGILFVFAMAYFVGFHQSTPPPPGHFELELREGATICLFHHCWTGK